MYGDDGVTMLLQDFLQLAGGGVPDVDRVILRPDSNELTVGGKGGAGPVATSLESLAAKCRTNLLHSEVDHLHRVISATRQ